jgi:hypothetical protein
LGDALRAKLETALNRRSLAEFANKVDLPGTSISGHHHPARMWGEMADKQAVLSLIY